MLLTIEQLSDLEGDILRELPDRITEILTRTNRCGDLQTLLKILNMEDLLEPETFYDTYREGKIVVVGQSEVKEDILLSIVKQLGLNKDRFEFCLDYYAAQKYDFKKMQYVPKYRLILFGPIPHSGIAKKDSSSIISSIEKKPGYPRVERLMSGGELKITKVNFKEKLSNLMQEGYI